MDKLADYCKWVSDYSREEIFKMLSCVKTIMYVEGLQIKEIVDDHGWDENSGANRLEVVYDKVKGCIWQLGIKMHSESEIGSEDVEI